MLDVLSFLTETGITIGQFRDKFVVSQALWYLNGRQIGYGDLSAIDIEQIQQHIEGGYFVIVLNPPTPTVPLKTQKKSPVVAEVGWLTDEGEYLITRESVSRICHELNDDQISGKPGKAFELVYSNISEKAAHEIMAIKVA